MLQIARADEKKNYAEIGFGWTAYEEAGWRLVPKIMKATVGTKIMDNLAIEGMGAFGIVDSSIGGVTLKVDSAFGAYAKPFFKLSDNVEIFGRLGFTRISGTASGGGGSIYGYDSGFSYGAGGAFKFDDTYALVVDYMQYYNKDGVNVYGVTSSLRIGF